MTITLLDGLVRLIGCYACFATL